MDKDVTPVIGCAGEVARTNGGRLVVEAHPKIHDLAYGLHEKD